jgi:hypothetical protein
MSIVTDSHHGCGLAIVHDSQSDPFCAEASKGATLPAEQGRGAQPAITGFGNILGWWCIFHWSESFSSAGGTL